MRDKYGAGKSGNSWFKGLPGNDTKWGLVKSKASKTITTVKKKIYKTAK